MDCKCAVFGLLIQGTNLASLMREGTPPGGCHLQTTQLCTQLKIGLLPYSTNSLL